MTKTGYGVMSVLTGNEVSSFKIKNLEWDHEQSFLEWDKKKSFFTWKEKEEGEWAELTAFPLPRTRTVPLDAPSFEYRPVAARP